MRVYQKTCKSFSFIFIAFFMAVTGCSNSVSPADQERTKLIGSWGWLYTQGDLARVDPSITGYTMGVVFHNDGTCQFYRNDTVTNSKLFRNFYQSTPCHTDALILYFGDSTINKISVDSIMNTNPQFVLFNSDTTMVLVSCEYSLYDVYKRK